MGFLNTNSMPRLVEKLADGDNIKITGNSKGNRVGTVIKKIVEKADDVTKAIEQEVVNDGYSFKVGTGDVDVSADVEDGFGEVGVKGVTYQNIVKSYEATNFSLLNATIEQGYFKIKHAENVNSSFVKVKVGTHLYKPNTKYTVIVDIKENTCDKNLGMSTILSCVSNLNPKNFINKTGISMSVITTRADISVDDKGNKPILDLYFGIWEEGGDLSNHITFRYWILEGDHTNTPNLPQYFEGMIGVGDKSKNLFNGKTRNGYYSNGVFTVNSSNLANAEPIKIKPNTYYSGSGDALPRMTFYDKDMNFISYHTTTPILSPSNACYLNIHAMGATYFQIEEGSVATSYEPYYGGHKIEILSHGKNLYKPNLQTKSSNGLTFSLHGNTLIVNGTCTKIVDFRPINGTESIALELYNYVSKLPVGTTLKLSNNLGLKNFFSLKRNGAQTYPTNTLIIQEGDYGISCFVRFEEGQSYNNAELKIQLEINNVATEFEPYIEDKTQILLDEPLMRLPNGVCDEITRDGKLIRRVGKIVFDGSEDWRKYSLNTNEYNTTNKTSVFYVQINDKSVGYNTSICDRFANTKNNDAFAMSAVRNGLYSDHINLPNLYFDYGENNSYSVTNFKQWLSQNPTTVYYELATPIITQLPAPYLRIFKDGHLRFNTLVAPESNHVVQLNKSAQIERSIREVQGLDSRVGQLESFYDDMILETSHKLNLLTYDFEYTKESEDI